MIFLFFNILFELEVNRKKINRNDKIEEKLIKYKSYVVWMNINKKKKNWRVSLHLFRKMKRE